MLMRQCRIARPCRELAPVPVEQSVQSVEVLSDLVIAMTAWSLETEHSVGGEGSRSPTRLPVQISDRLPSQGNRCMERLASLCC